ncbi:2'-5' RNA ligase family protein [Rhizobium sp. BR 362]|uniref:2'-5' RNA ligase family protein n=1 Tax=Rhizobium sp. BR 362 TaxID=3040670 RepID=UPI002F409B60
MFDVRQTQLPFGMTEPETPPPRTQTRQGSENLYFALLPDEPVGNEIDKLMVILGQSYRLLGRARPPGLRHVSVHGFGKYPKRRDDITAIAMRAAKTIQHCEFTLVFDHVLSFRQPSHPLVLCPTDGVKEFRRLQLQLGLAVYEAGLAVCLDPGYQPHITLQYGRTPVPRVDLEKPITWTVRKFVLVNSLQGLSKHEYIDQWPLLN